MKQKYDWKRIGERIKQEREELKLDQIELGEQLGISRQTVSNWERGRAYPSVDDMGRLCGIFNCEIGYLLCEYDCKTKESADVCAVTGLSEEAVNMLIKLNTNEEDALILTVLSYLLGEDDLVFALAAAASAFKTKINQINDIKKHGESYGYIWGDYHRLLDDEEEKLKNTLEQKGLTIMPIRYTISKYIQEAEELFGSTIKQVVDWMGMLEKLPTDTREGIEKLIKNLKNTDQED